MTLRNSNSARRRNSATGVLVSILLTTTAVNAAPAIRMTGQNRVPACVTPDRLMSFLAGRNERLDPRYREIANWYRHYGEAWQVRWDYAFFQMVLETNALKYRRGDGRPGDVRETQNNFAGIGATGGGVPGDRFPDIKSGVHAQIQHLVAYSGERIAEPIARRTRERQDDIIDQSRRLRRPVTFGDLARRWAADRMYAKSIDTVAGLFKETYCNGSTVTDRAPPQPVPAVRKTSFNYDPPSRLGGPKDQMRLAGPDELPWTGPAPTGRPEAGTPQAQAAPEKPEPAKPSRSPVRTIWSRDGDADLDSVAGATPADTPPAPPAADVKPLPEPTPAPEAADSGFLLPKFKIMPSKIEPSKLGGPIDSEHAGGLDVSVPIDRPAKSTPVAPAPVAERSALMSPPRAPAPAGGCQVQAASYGGKKTLLLRDTAGGTTRYTALTVLEGFEKSMVDTFAKAHALTVEVIGEYSSKDAALADANANCASG